MSDHPSYVVHCPSCPYATIKTQGRAHAHQKRHACPTCNRGLACKRVADASPDLRERALNDAGPSVEKARA